MVSNGEGSEEYNKWSQTGWTWPEMAEKSPKSDLKSCETVKQESIFVFSSSDDPLRHGGKA